MKHKIVQALAWDNKYGELVVFNHSARNTYGYCFSRSYIPPYEYDWHWVHWSNYKSIAQMLRHKRYTVLHLQTGATQ